MRLNNIFRSFLLLTLFSAAVAKAQSSGNEVPIFITIGQSNADGSAFFNADIDNEMRGWYTSSANTGLMKMWYRSSKKVTQSSVNPNTGETPRWIFDGDVTDVEPGWLNLWYRNENTDGRTAMNINDYGSYTTGDGTDCAQGRRGMEGNFGRVFATAMPESEMYFIKLGVSGTMISAWSNPLDDHNWDYFYDKIFKPALTSLLEQGKRPVIAGVWWMQGCGDAGKTKDYYQTCLTRLVERINNNLGCPNAKVYIGFIPTRSAGYGQGVRNAQKEVVSLFGQCEAVETDSYSMQYESSLGGYVHFDHAGINAIGEELANRVLAAGATSWTPFSTPGKWVKNGDDIVFAPDFGNPTIDYSNDGSTLTATLVYPGFTETKTYTPAVADPAEGELVTIEQPVGATITVYNDGTAVASGTEFVAGTVLTLGVSADDNYNLVSFTVNGKPVTGNTFIVEGASVVSAVLDYNATYTEPTGDGGSGANSYVECASTTGAIQNITIYRNSKNSSNWELCDDNTIVVEPGMTFTLRLQAKVTSTVTSSVPSPQDLRYCVGFLFTDWNGDCIFEPVQITTGTFSGQYYYGYHCNQTGFGGNIKANYDHVLDISHEFTVPDDATVGDTRIRVIYTEAWDNNVRSAGEISGNYQNINKGYAYDYLVSVQLPTSVDHAAASDISTTAPYHTYDLQGKAVNTTSLTPGVYIVRRGDTVSKTIIR